VKKKKLLGCSFPVFIVILVLVIGMLLVSVAAGPVGTSLLSLFGINLTFPSWMVTHKPEIVLPAETIFHIFGFPISNAVMTGWITIVVLVLFFWAATRKMKIVPKGLQNFAEWVLEYIYNLCKTVAGEENGRRFFPLVATIFLFVITNAWMNLIPGYGSILVHTAEGDFPLLRGANTDVNLPLALALVSFVFVTYHGFRVNKLHYLSEFINIGPMLKGLGNIFTGKFKAGIGGFFSGFISFFIGIIELLGQFIRIISFTFRLFGNMTAGEILILIIMFLVPWVVAPIFYGLELLVGYIQALIFAGLTLVFVSVATIPHETEHQ